MKKHFILHNNNITTILMFLVEIKNSTRSRRIKFLFFKEFYYLPFFRETMITKRPCNMFPFKPDKLPSTPLCLPPWEREKKVSKQAEFEGLFIRHSRMILGLPLTQRNHNMPKHKNATELIFYPLELFISPNTTEILGWILFVVGTVTFTAWYSAVSNLHSLEASGTKVETSSSIIAYHQMSSEERPWLEMPALKQELLNFCLCPSFLSRSVNTPWE